MPIENRHTGSRINLAKLNLSGLYEYVFTCFKYFRRCLKYSTETTPACRQAGIEFCGGDDTGVVPPVPISNTEVKYSKADDSVMNAKVGSRHLRTQYQNTQSKKPIVSALYLQFWLQLCKN